MKRRAALLLLSVASGAAAQQADWRRVATPPDRERIRQWRNAWRGALAEVRASGLADRLRDPALFDPDRVTEGAVPPPGPYRCRTFRLGGIRVFAAIDPVGCRVAEDGGFAMTEGAMRIGGRFYRDTEARAIFLGTTLLADERRSLRYGRDDRRDTAGLVERVGPSRWRLVMPYPRFGSTLDVVEMVPAGA